jgi:hypothetical protein
VLLGEVQVELLDVRSRSDLDTRDISSRLRRVHRILGRLGAVHGRWVRPTDEETGKQELEKDARLSVFVTAPTGGVSAQAGESLLGSWVRNAVFDPARSALQVLADVSATGSGLVLEILAIAVSLIVAVAASFLVLYKNEPFGDIGDYLAVFALGAGAEVVLSGLIGMLERRRQPLFTPQDSATAGAVPITTQEHSTA